MIVILLFNFDSSFQHILLQKVIGDTHKSDFTTNSFFIKQTNIRMSLHRFEHPCFSLVQKVQECTRLVYKKTDISTPIATEYEFVFFSFLSEGVFFQSPRNEFPCPSSSHFLGLHHLRRRAS